MKFKECTPGAYKNLLAGAALLALPGAGLSPQNVGAAGGFPPSGGLLNGTALQAVGSDLISLFCVLLAFVFQALILYLLWRRYFLGQAVWMLWGGMLALGAAYPVFWLVQVASGVGTASAAGQVFLLGGVFTLLASVTRKKRQPALLLACGTFLTLAVACRTNLLPAALWCALAAFLWLAQHGGIRRTLFGMFWFCMIPVIGIILVLVQIGARSDVPAVDFRAGTRFSAANLAFSLFMPPDVRAEFPFFYARTGEETPAEWLALPEGYRFRGPFAGVFVAAPFTLFGLLGLCEAWISARSVMGALARRRRCLSIDWVFLFLGGCFPAAFLPGMFASSVSVPSLWDFFPVLGLLSVVGAWFACRRWSDKPALRKTITACYGSAVLISVLLAGLLSLSTPPASFPDAVPAYALKPASLSAWIVNTIRNHVF